MKRENAWLISLSVFAIVSISFIGTVIADETRSNECAEIKVLEITGSIDNSYAVTDVKEELYNPYDHAIEEVFIFQIPESAYISNFSLTFNGTTYYSEVVPKDEARERYDEAARQGKNAGLLESRGSSLFSFSISIEPHETITVGLRYEDFIVKTLGIYYYNVFLITDPYGRTIDEFAIGTTIISGLEITSLDVQNYKDDLNVHWSGNNEVTISASADSIKLEEDFKVQYETAPPPVNGLLLDYFNGEEGFFLHLFSPEIEDVGGALDKDIIFVLDKSGSMSGDKIGQLKDAFSEITKQLPEDDKFNIIIFDGEIEEYSDSLLQASEDEKADADNYIGAIEAEGSTNINDALLRGLEMIETYESRVPIIVFLTDGQPTRSITDTQQIRSNVMSANDCDTAIFSLGFGYDVDFDFLSALSLENYGYAIRIYEGTDASLQITDFYDIISTPLLKDLVFSYSEGTYEIYDTEVSHLFEGSDTVVAGKYQSGVDIIESKAVAQSKNGEVQYEEKFRLGCGSEHPFIERFWAYRKINYLIDEIKVAGEEDSLVSEVVNLSVRYSFVTPYTSLLIEIYEDEAQEDNQQQNTPPPANSNPNTMSSNQPSYSFKNSQPNPNSPQAPSTNYGGGGTMDCEAESVSMSFPGLFILIILVTGVLVGITIKKYWRKKKQ